MLVTFRVGNTMHMPTNFDLPTTLHAHGDLESRLVTESDARSLVEQLRRENKTLRQEITRYQHLAYRDDVTGLANRRFFEERVAQELSRASRSGEALSILLIDMDDFKKINDAAGHATGDRVLAWVGSFLKHNARDFDVPCRIGGDEFAVILPCADRDGADAVVARLTLARATAADLPTLPSGLNVAFSIGVATYPDAGATLDQLMAAADEAMYADKRRRKSADVVVNRREGTLVESCAA